MVAWPVSYGQTGIMSFIIDQDDKVYQRNLGADSQQQAQAMSAFTTAPGWQPVAR